MLLDTEDWAARHHYFWHSNPRRPRAKALFDKCHVRPLLRQAWETIKDDGSSPEQKKNAWDIVNRLDPKINGASSAAMFAGIQVQNACDEILIEELDPAQAIEEQLSRYRDYKPREWDDGSDAARHQKYIEELPAVVDHAVMGLREAMARDNRILGEIELLEKLPGLALPHNTRPDYNSRGDLKTKWSSPSKRSKSGWQNASLPSSLTGMFDLNNVFQAAGFWALNGGQAPFLVYANASDYRILHPENCDELKDDFLADVVEEIKVQHRCTENLLRAAETKEQLLGMVAPDFNEIAWREPPGYIAEAKRVWGIQ